MGHYNAMMDSQPAPGTSHDLSFNDIDPQDLVASLVTTILRI